MHRVRLVSILAAFSVIAIFVLIALRFNQTRDPMDFQIDPSPTVMPTDEPVAEGTPTPDDEARVNIYMVALEDNGASGMKIGCNDSLVPVQRDIESLDTPIEDTLDLLFSLDDEYYGESGLYNSLYQSDLSVSEINENTTQVTVRITGSVKLGGTCDSPRFQEQIETTVEQFAGDKTVVIYLNNIPLSQALSQQ